jgi:predicted nuclease of restriction endonuclease-like (RecB) superfamily
MNNKKLTNSDNIFYNDIRAILNEARNKTYRFINSAMVETYWQIGKRIVEQEQQGENRADYGSNLIKNLSVKLSHDFGKGFSIANLKNMRQFYMVLKDDPKSYTLCSQLGWSHVRSIMRIENLRIREYYLKETKSQGWSVRQLQRNINSYYYERLLSSRKQNKSLEKSFKKPELINRDFIKDPYILEFLGMPENTKYLESKLEKAIIDNLQKFLLELGKGFSFVGRQFRISTGKMIYEK